MDGDINSSFISSIDCVHRFTLRGVCGCTIHRLKTNTERVQETQKSETIEPALEETYKKNLPCSAERPRIGQI